MRLLACVSLLFAISAFARRIPAETSVSATAAVSSALSSARSTRAPGARKNEIKLGGMEPGKSRLREAIAMLGTPTGKNLWRTADGAEITLDLDENQVVQIVRMAQSFRAAGKQLDCAGCVAKGRMWMTGSGLRLGSPETRVFELYGEPDSRSPSTKDGQRLELLYYAFDWAGADVPQVMEVLCTVEKNGVPGQVVEITLAASSL
jgi:hypothetical protein